jgi:hypothetical protein
MIVSDYRTIKEDACAIAWGEERDLKKELSTINRYSLILDGEQIYKAVSRF